MGRPHKLSPAQREHITQLLRNPGIRVAVLASQYDVCDDTIRALLPTSRRRGCYNVRNDLMGCVFGEWTVLGPAEPRPDLVSRHKRWECRCSCGTIGDVRHDQLMRGRSVRCSSCVRDKKGRNR